jgi:hypothetical protein
VSAPREEWIFEVAAGVDPKEPRPHAVCRRCGERFVHTFPMRVDTYIETARAFSRVHRRCPAPTPPPEPAP